MNNTYAIIQMRLGSKRLPNKGLMKLGNKLVLEHIVDRLKAVNVLKKGLIDKIIVATTINKEDKKIVEWCKKNKVICYTGEDTDVLLRFYKCAGKYDAQWILRICGDSPFIEPLMLYGLITAKTRRPYQALAFNQRRIPGGWDAELFSFDWLKKCHETSTEREHFSVQMRGKDEDIADYGTDFDFEGISLELNTKSDFRRLKKYAELL